MPRSLLLNIWEHAFLKLRFFLEETLELLTWTPPKNCGFFLGPQALYQRCFICFFWRADVQNCLEHCKGESDWPVCCFGPLIRSLEWNLETIPSKYQYNRTGDKKLGCGVCLLFFFWTGLVRWMLKGSFNWMHVWQWERKKPFFLRKPKKYFAVYIRQVHFS